MRNSLNQVGGGVNNSFTRNGKSWKLFRKIEADETKRIFRPPFGENGLLLKTFLGLRFPLPTSNGGLSFHMPLPPKQNCSYCGKLDFSSSRKTIEKKERSGISIRYPVCGSCFAKVAKRIIPNTATPSDLNIAAKAKECIALTHSLSKKTSLTEWNDIVNVINDLIPFLDCTIRDFNEKTKEAVLLAEKIEWLQKTIGEAKVAVQTRCLQTYESCRYAANKFTSNRIIRELVFKKDGYACRFCGVKQNLSLDHIIPIKKGGTNDMDNLQTLCVSCNCGKSDKIYNDKDLL